MRLNRHPWTRALTRKPGRREPTVPPKGRAGTSPKDWTTGLDLDLHQEFSPAARARIAAGEVRMPTSHDGWPHKPDSCRRCLAIRELAEGVINGQAYPYPHCNSEVLHAPGRCVYCDAFPNRQSVRAASGGGFTPDEANGWQGNVAVPEAFRG